MGKKNFSRGLGGERGKTWGGWRKPVTPTRESHRVSRKNNCSPGPKLIKNKKKEKEGRGVFGRKIRGLTFQRSGGKVGC